MVEGVRSGGLSSFSAAPAQSGCDRAGPRRVVRGALRPGHLWNCGLRQLFQIFCAGRSGRPPCRDVSSRGGAIGGTVSRTCRHAWALASSQGTLTSWCATSRSRPVVRTWPARISLLDGLTSGGSCSTLLATLRERRSAADIPLFRLEKFWNDR